ATARSPSAARPSRCHDVLTVSSGAPPAGLGWQGIPVDGLHVRIADGSYQGAGPYARVCFLGGIAEVIHGHRAADRLLEYPIAEPIGSRRQFREISMTKAALATQGGGAGRTENGAAFGERPEPAACGGGHTNYGAGAGVGQGKGAAARVAEFV